MQDMQAKQNEEVTIDLWRLAKAVWRRAWLIVIVVIVFGILSYAASAMFITPTYRSSFTAYVNNRKITAAGGSTTSSDLNASISLAKLYSEIITSRSVLTESAQSCGMQISYDRLSQMVKTETSTTSALITVYVETTDPVQATELAAAIAYIAPNYMSNVVEGSDMKIVDNPVQPENKFSPNNGKNAVLGALIAMVLAVGIIVVIELVDDKVKSASDLENRYQMVVIGNIPDLEEAMKNRDKYAYAKGGRG